MEETLAILLNGRLAVTCVYIYINSLLVLTIFGASHIRQVNCTRLGLCIIDIMMGGILLVQKTIRNPFSVSMMVYFCFYLTHEGNERGWACL